MSSLKSSNWSSYFIAQNAKPVLLLIILCLGISSFLGVKTPLLIQELFSSYGTDEVFFKVLYSLAIIFVAEYIVRVIYQLSVNYYMRNLIHQVRGNSFNYWLLGHEVKKEGDGKDEYPLGEVLARLMNDTDAVGELLNSGSFGIFIDLFYIGSCLISFLSLNSTSGVFMITAEVIACGILIWGSKYMARIFMSVRKETGLLSRKISDLIGGFSQIVYTPNKKYSSKTGEKYADSFLKVQLEANVWDASYYSLAESLFPILLVMLIFVFPHSQITELATIAALIDLIQRSIDPIKDISGKVSNFQRAFTGLQRIRQFQSDLSEHVVDYDGLSDKFIERIDKFENFDLDLQYFCYDKNKTNSSFALKNIQIEGKRGELIGIVGLSGSGKSTLLNILAGNLLPQLNAFQINLNFEQHSVSFPSENKNSYFAYRECIGIVSQDSHIFSQTLAFNIALGLKHNPDDLKRFWSSVKHEISYVDSWGIELNDRINPKDLSLGQKQLLAALRTCFLKKPIVLFDEVSSGLDSSLEEALRLMIRRIQSQSLTIIVAHRLETVIRADNIVLMHNGEICSQGSHEALMAQSELYQKFIKQLTKA